MSKITLVAGASFAENLTYMMLKLDVIEEVLNENIKCSRKIQYSCVREHD